MAEGCMRWPGTAFVVVLVLSVGTVPTVAAQTVTGVLVDGSTGRGIPGAFVTLIDPTGREVASRLTNADGLYQVQAPGPGRYTLRAERIGYTPGESSPFDLAVDERVTYRFEISVTAVQLEGIRVPTRSRCAAHPSRNEGMARVWEQARQALSATAVTASDRDYRFRALHSERRLDPESLAVENQRGRIIDLAGQSPFASVDAADLERGGFVQRRNGDTYFYAPDLDLLLSDSFLGMHCFRLVDGSAGEAGLIGLAFEPAPGRRVPGIQGTLWLDRETAELRRLEFRYTRLPWDLPTENIGGRVEFTPLATGAWIISRWWIRTPYLGVRTFQAGSGARRERTFISAIREEGTTVLEVREPSGDRIAGLPDDLLADLVADLPRMVVEPGIRVLGTTSLMPGVEARISGRIVDAETGDPVPGVVVTVDGTRAKGVSDEDGGFQVTAVPTGSRTLRVNHPDFGSDAATLVVRPWEAVQTEVALMHRGPGQPRSSAVQPASQVAGQVVLEGWGEPMPGTTVVLMDRETALDSVTASEDGTYVLPLPATGSYRLQARHGSSPDAWSPPVSFRPGELIGPVILELPSPLFQRAQSCHGTEAPAGTGVLAGVVVDSDTEMPVPSARVMLEWDERGNRGIREITASSAGHFVVCAVPAGVAMTARVHALGAVSAQHGGIVVQDGALARYDLTLDLAGRGALAGAVLEAETRSVDGPSRLSGQLLDATTRRPVPAARITLSGHREVLSGQDGRFSFTGLEPGSYDIEVDHVGYGRPSAAVEVGANSEVAVLFRVPPRAIELEGLAVRARRQTMASRMAGARPHRTMAGPRLADVQRRGAPLSELLYEIAGIRLNYARAGGEGALQVCAEATRGRGMGGGCNMIEVFVDGVTVPDAVARQLLTTGVTDYERIEYLPPGEAMRWGMRAAEAGALFLWTTRAPGGSR